MIILEIEVNLSENLFESKNKEDIILKVTIDLENDGYVTISDNGRGIPTDIHSKTGLSTVETVLTVLHAGGKFDSETYKVSGGLHGVGASVVNALSKHLKV